MGKKSKQKSGDSPGSRQLRHLSLLASTFPNVWRNAEKYRRLRGAADLPDWPAECYLPINASSLIAYEVMLQGITKEKVERIIWLPPLCAWSIGKGIYRFDPTVFESVWETPLEGELPTELLNYMPEWGVYIETPGRTVIGEPLYGFYATLDYDPRFDNKGLHLLVDSLSGLHAVRLPLQQGGLEASVRDYGRKDRTKEYAKEMGHLVALVLYVCSITAEFRDASGSQRQPGLPIGERAKNGSGLTGTEKPTVWETAYRMGAALRRALRDHENSSAGGGTPHASPRPHIRRAHFHSFWTGRLDQPEERKLILKWIPPIPVKAETPDDLIPTVKLVY